MSFEFHIESSENPTRSKPLFKTACLYVGESFLRYPENCGFEIPEYARIAIQELFPEPGSIVEALREIKNGSRLRVFENIPGVRIVVSGKTSGNHW